MKRAYQADAIQVKADYTTLKSEGWPTNGDPLNSQPPTQPGAAWHQMVTEELVSVIEAADMTPDNEPQLKAALDTLMDREIEEAKAVFVTVNGDGTQTVNQSKIFTAVNYGKKLEQSADLAADSTAVPVWSNICDYAAGLNRANVMQQDNIFNAGVTVKGKLTATGGVTGNVTGNASTATKLAVARTLRINLASTAAASFDGSANVTPGVTGTLPAANGEWRVQRYPFQQFNVLCRRNYCCNRRQSDHWRQQDLQRYFNSSRQVHRLRRRHINRELDLPHA